jgi:hypothetical protein
MFDVAWSVLAKPRQCTLEMREPTIKLISTSMRYAEVSGAPRDPRVNIDRLYGQILTRL